MKKVVAAVLSVSLVMLCASSLCAASWRDGKKIYRDVCTNCHSSRGDAPRLQLNERSKAEWSKFFTQKPATVHQEAWKALSEDELKSLEKYFQKYAKDDKQVLGCG